MNDYGYIALFWDHQASDKSVFRCQSCDEYFTAIGSTAGDFNTLYVSGVHLSSTTDTDIMIIPEMRHKIDVSIFERFLFHLQGAISFLPKQSLTFCACKWFMFCRHVPPISFINTSVNILNEILIFKAEKFRFY